MAVGLQGWILAGGAHHTAYTQSLTIDYIEDLADMLGVELVVIDQSTTLRSLKKDLQSGDVIYR